MRRLLSTLVLVVATAAAGAATARADDPVTELVPGTAVLLNEVSGSGSGSTSSTSSKTAIFSPAAYSDFKRYGAEPTVAVDRYPFVPGPFAFGATAADYRDLTYTSAPIGVGFPGFSNFWKSDDLARTFRVPLRMPIVGRVLAGGTGGGDSHQAVGQVTHKVFFVDLPADCVTVNTSTDLGETFTADELGCGASPGFDDRQWIEVDETVPGANSACLAGTTPTCGNVYISFISFSNVAAPTLVLARSTKDGAPGSFAVPTDSPCDYLTGATLGALDSTATACPDPFDPELQIAGPVVADNEGTAARPATHNLYIPFIRAPGDPSPVLSAMPPYRLYVARSTDGGVSWTRHLVAYLGDRNPSNIFPQLAVDRGGNLYFTWAQTQGPGADETGLTGETDVYYAFSTTKGASWSAPIPLTQEQGDSAVFPWMVAGDPGQVDLVFYKSNTGLNPNVAALDENGNPCEPDLPLISIAPCAQANPSVWNVYFSQSQNALNTGSNFKSVQISDHPTHRGQICTGGTACATGGNRGLLDFFTVDVDHLGAAVVAWADDNHSVAGIARTKVARQLAGNSVYKNQAINLQSTWGIKDHSVVDRAGDTYDGVGNPNPACRGMDILGASASRSDDLITMSLTLDGPPAASAATACGTAANGGVWGAEFWASSSRGADNFYIAYVDNPLDPAHVEGGNLFNLNPTTTSLEFTRLTDGTLGGTCFPSTGPSPSGACTITMTVSAAALGIKSGAGLYSITPISTHVVGTDLFPFLGNSEHADAALAFDYMGTGTTTK